MSVAAPLKIYSMSPNAILDHGIDWSDWLDHDTISTSSWSAAAGITVASSTKTASAAYCVVTAGATPGSYDVTNTITTSQGRTDSRTIRIVVVQR